MAVTFLVLAHEDPAGVARLVDRLRAPGHRFVVHIDRRVPLAEFSAALSGSDVLVLNDEQRRVCHWAGWSIAEAMLTLLEMAQRHAPADFYQFISGADYPLQPAAAIGTYLRAGNSRVVVWREIHPDRRTALRRRHAVFGRTFNEVAWMNRREQLQFSLPVRWLARALVLGLKAMSVLLPLRRPPENMRVFRGSQWCALSAQQAAAISARMAGSHGEDVRRFFLRSAAPDEMLVQSLLRYLQLTEGVVESPQAGVRHGTHWIDWRDEFSPAALDTGSVNEALASGALFCRKLARTGTHDGELLRAHIDAALLKEAP